MKRHGIQTFIYLAIAVIFLAVSAGIPEDADARARSGGRSFGGSGGSSGSFSKPSIPPSRPMAPSTSPSGGMGGSSFMRGLGGGLLGGMIGGMLFSSPGHSMGVGGMGGSGIGIIELLLLGGLGYFLYKRFIKPNRSGSPGFQMPSIFQSPGQSGFTPGNPSGVFPPAPPMTELTVADGIDQIRQSEPDFDPERFKELAQDVFFKIQAAWMRRDMAPVRGLIGNQLLAQYEAHLNELKQNGLLNRLENIAVRQVSITDAGMENNEVYVTIQFVANLLDYTVNESSGEIVEGNNIQPVKFEEKWMFARPVNTTAWKLEGVSQ
ncbi:MAG: Tim44 domain-containing protein [Desulfatirhabdiaceae bacterium]